MTTTTKKYPVLTEEATAEARKLIGVELRRRRPWNSVATVDAIKFFTHSIGSRNPLYISETYGRSTSYGTLIAHPTFLYSFDDTIVAPKLPGIHSIYAGADWEFFRVVKLNDAIKAVAKLTDVIEKTGQFCGRMALQVGEVAYTNQWSQLIARVKTSVMRTPRDAAREKAKYLGISKYRYTTEELRAIGDAYDNEEIRGSEVRYWEGTNVGEEIAAVVKGPLTSDDMLQFMAATGGVRTFEVAMRYQRRHPAEIYFDEVHGMWDSWEASFLKDVVAQEFGWPAAHDTGYQRICWLDNAITNWMGDHAFLHSLDVRVTRPNIYGDITWAKGKVARKYRTDKQSFVELEVWCANQRGETTAKGTAVVSLLDKRLGSLPQVFLIDGTHRHRGRT